MQHIQYTTYAYKTQTSSLLQHQHIIIPVYNYCHQTTTLRQFCQNVKNIKGVQN